MPRVRRVSSSKLFHWASLNARRDPEVDALNKQLHRVLASYMIERPGTITRALNLMVVSKSLERIADHAAHITEEVVFLYEGRDIRHSGPGGSGP